ncbi:DUF3302 domain-containing protein [Cellvibrio sp. NN19]|uniref:DUF3302 domain-containing protein n=1 Tax=Cellvibrio chitinivorans TaxID=3102792 RepID=UPI002B400B03|nr:DUF3302 domain-containing protein [Cellvibrio sp. NN19]
MNSNTVLLLRRFAYPALLLISSTYPLTAWAMQEGMEEKIADVVVWIVIVAIPIGALYLFWKLHTLPEMIAEKKQHPQKGAIQVLCLLSLVFGGLLWPIAWLWAYTKPTNYKMAYGTDKHDDFFLKPNGEAPQNMELAVIDDELAQLKEKLDGLEKKRELIIASQDTPAQEQHHA